MRSHLSVLHFLEGGSLWPKALAKRINEKAPENNLMLATFPIRAAVNEEKQRLFSKPGDVLVAAENYIEELGTKRSKGSLES
nr:hypothetical protein CFP56_55164 [Quercus suber]